MPWQKITNWIHEERVEVESKSGNTYPAHVPYSWMSDGIHKQMINRAHDEKTFWAWVSFDGDDDPVVEDWIRNDGDYPGAPPWDR